MPSHAKKNASAHSHGPSRQETVDAALSDFDSGIFEKRLSDLIQTQSCSQEPTKRADLEFYLTKNLTPWLHQMGFNVEIFPNPDGASGPIMIAERLEPGADLTILSYAHGDTVSGLDPQWTVGLGPWKLATVDGRWYGRGTADNKGQHAINLFALEHVIKGRRGKLGFNLKLVVETAEEVGSAGLEKFVAHHAHRLQADFFIASDGPRVSPETPTLAAGSRGSFTFNLTVNLRDGPVHSGHWGGVTNDPALILAHVLTTLADRQGRIAIEAWLPPEGLSQVARDLLKFCPHDEESDAAEADPEWGQPGLSMAEKRYAWNAFVILAMTAGCPEAPANAVAPTARATCQVRYEPGTNPHEFMPALRRHLDDLGYPFVSIENEEITMEASATPLSHPILARVKKSMETTLAKAVQLIPAVSGGMPGHVFQKNLDLPLVWIPHGHNSCRQHGPDEHLLITCARDGVAAFSGLWWDMGNRNFFIHET